MDRQRQFLVLGNILLTALVLQGCRHPLAIIGEGDIVDVNNSGRGCTLEQFKAQDSACTDNEVSGDYYVNYKAVPRPGWRFVRWDGPCSEQSEIQHCRLDVPTAGVSWWHENYPDEILSSTAVFARITGETGFLVGPGTAVVGVSYETPTQNGVTGPDGSFQYEEGETVRFTIGATVLGEVTGQAQVTPFDLAGSAVITGIDIARAMGFQLPRRNAYPRCFNHAKFSCTVPGGEPNPFPEPYPPNGPLAQHRGEPHYVTVELFVRKPDPFHTVLNVAVLLQSLDGDADPNNGMEIKPAVAALFRGVSLDLRQGWETFRNEPALWHALWRANKKRLFSKRHGAVNPAAAIRHVYQTLGTNARTVGVSLDQGTYGLEGSVWQESSRYQYDVGGNLTRYEQGWGDDMVDLVLSYEYDADGNLARHEIEDYDIDAPNEALSWQYFQGGKMPRIEWDWDGDGGSDYIEEWQFDADGNAKQLMNWINSWAEDGVVNQESGSITREYYFTNGNLTCVLKRVEWASDDGSTSESIDSYEYDSHGRLRRREEDHDLDGVPELIESWQYDTNGSLTRHQSNSRDDGLIVWTWQYDANGNRTRYELDEDGDGNPNWIGSYQYDVNGNPTRVGLQELPEDGGRSGIPNDTMTWQYEYDFDGNLTRHEHHNHVQDESGTVQYQYDASGKLTSEEREERYFNGRLNETVSYSYDTNDNLIRVSKIRQGKLDRVLSWQYDADGKLTRYEERNNGPTHQRVRQYEATGWGQFFRISMPDDPR